MNRLRMIMFGVFGALGFVSASAQAQDMMSAPTRTHAYATSRFYYTRGYSYVAAPRYSSRYIYPAPARVYTPPSRSITRSQIGSSYDPTGRHDGLARPWLR